MSFRFSWATAALLCVASLPTHALTLDEALAAAGAQAPDLFASRAAETAAQALTLSAGALPDPKLTLGVDNLPIEGIDRYQTGKSMRSVGLMQEFPNAAKREAERQMATAQWQASSAQNRYALLNVQRETTLAWLSLYYLDRKAEVLTAQEAENRNSLALTQATLAAGGTAQNALAAQLETQQLADSRDDLNSDLRRDQAVLARWTGPDAARQPLTGGLPDWVRTATTAADFSQQPDLHAAGSQIEAARAELALAEAGKRPDWGLELALERSEMGQNQAMVKLSFDLPLFGASRQDPKIAAAVANLQRAQAERDARSAGYRQQYAELQAQHDAVTTQLARLKQTVLPLLDRQTELALASFKSGQDASAAVLETRKARLAARLRAIDLESRLAAANAQLYFLAGGL